MPKSKPTTDMVKYSVVRCEVGGEEAFADTLRRLDGYPLAMQERTTFYGMREVGVIEPEGNIVIFAVKV